jgi:hypothetical protein
MVAKHISVGYQQTIGWYKWMAKMLVAHLLQEYRR